MLTRFTDRKLFFPVLNFVAIVATMWALLVIFDKPTSGKSASNRQGSNVLAIVIAIVGVGGGAVSSVVIYKAIAQLQTLDGSLQERTKELNDANAQLRAYNESLAETVSRRTNELLFAELQYRSLFDATAELILICDGKSNALEVNRPVEMFFGCDRNNLRGFNLLEKIHPEDRQRVGDAIVETNRGEIVAEEVRIRSRTGEEQFFLAEFSPLLMDRESIVGFKVLMKDITPEKQNQIEQEV
ncbi:MAG: PAS domain-containing protein, partial [Rhizobacter sp.]|nr:PAS domain-containing protein [Chlorobiales bacterium]